MELNENTQKFYYLTEVADNDLENIYEYSFREFGFLKAEDYLNGFHYLFQQLTRFPNEGILRSDLIRNIRSIPYQSHVIFYFVQAESILIARILHQSQNASDYFEK